MEILDFAGCFRFNEFYFENYKYTDNRGGTPIGYVGYMKRGTARLVTTDNEINVETGHLFYIPKKCRYESFWYGKPEIDFLSFGFTSFPNDDVISCPLQLIPTNEKVLCQMKKIPIGKPTDCQALGEFMLFLGMLLPTMKTERCGRQYITVKKATELMRQDNSLSLAQVADGCKVSESTLYADFRSVTGDTPAMARQKIRAEIAVNLLTTSNLSVEDVSDRSGFSSSSYMRKIVRKFYGLTPNEIKKKYAL